MPKLKSMQSSTVLDLVGDSYFIDFANTDFENIGRLAHPNETFVESRLRDVTERPEARSKLRKMLDEIIKDKEIKDSEELRYFIKLCEKHVLKYEVKNGKLIKNLTIEYGPVEFLMYPMWLRDLAFSVVEYLSNPNINIKKIKRCSVCRDYFIATNIRREVCPYPLKDCEKIRKRDWQRNWMQERRDPGSPKFDLKYI